MGFVDKENQPKDGRIIANQKVERLIECVAKENYDNFCHAVMMTEIQRRNKQTVIFGAGILGLQCYYTFQELEVQDIVFCDNDSAKWGRQIENCQILSPDEIIGKMDQYFIFLAIENYQQCLHQIEEMGYQRGEQYYNLTNCSECKLLNDFQKDCGAQTLILGDCTVSAISVADRGKESLADLLYQRDNVKILALNGLYMRAYYNLFLMSLKKMSGLNKVVILLGLDIFGEKYHLLSQNQHLIMMTELLQRSGISSEESAAFGEEIRRRAQERNIFRLTAPNRESGISKIKIEQGRRLHMRLNYLYDLKEDTESIQYLKQMLKVCKQHRIDNIYIFMPVNYEMGEYYFGDTFYQKYNGLRNTLARHITEGGGQLVDLSYLLGGNDFISLRSTNEGIREAGRRKLAAEIKKQI